jgi:LysM repeat protein
MKKEVQALINRRRARMVPAILLGVAGVILVGIIVLVALTFANGPGLGLVKTDTPVPSATASVTPSPTPVPPTNTPEATATETVTSGPSPTSTPVLYTVVAGDNLFTIAEQFRANVCTMMIINNITDPTLLSVGQVLIIPGPDTVLPSPTPLPTGLPRGTVLQYVVQCGDTLDSIAGLFNSTGEDIAETNDIDDPLSIQIGQVLNIRVNIATPTPTMSPTAAPATQAGTQPASATP